MASSSKKSKESGQWLDAYSDYVANVKTRGSNIVLADVYGDGNHRLLIGDFGCILRLYKGNQLVARHALLDIPTSVCSFYLTEATDTQATMRTPAVAVSAGPVIYIYRNMASYYKFTLPNVEVAEEEKEVWGELLSDKTDIGASVERLAKLREEKGIELSHRSCDLLACEDETAQVAFIKSVENVPWSQKTTITCMKVLHKNRDEDDDEGMLVLGTEQKIVYLLASDTKGFKIVAKVKVPSVPSLIAVVGEYAVNHRIVVAGRDGRLYSIKKNELLGTVIEMAVQPVGLVLLDDKNIHVGCMDKTIRCYHVKGKKTHTIFLPSTIVEMELLHRRSRNQKCIMVSLMNGEIRIYSEKVLVSLIKTNSPVTGMKFGQYGLEEDNLVYTQKNGTVSVKILPWNQNLDGKSGDIDGPPPEQDMPLNVPKKTSVYVDQTQRERDTCSDMHRIFQRDLYKLRLSTARAFVKTLREGLAPTTSAAGASIKLNAQVLGIGPHFNIKLHIENTGHAPIIDLPILFVYNHSLYRMRHPILKVPMLVPGMAYQFVCPVESVDEQGGAEAIRLYVCKPDPKACVPLISAVVNMPLSELIFEGR